MSLLFVAGGSGGLYSYTVDSAGDMTLVDTDDQGGTYKGVWGDDNFIYVAAGAIGLVTYSYDASGNLTHCDTEAFGTDCRGVYGDGTFIYVAAGADGLASFSVDGSGNITSEDSDDQGDIYQCVHGDGNFIYVGTDSVGVHSYSVDGSGNLTHVDVDDQGGSYYGVYSDGTYLCCATFYSMVSYTVDGSGNLTLVDTEYPAGGEHCKGCFTDLYGVVYSGGNDGNLLSWTTSSGVFTYADKTSCGGGGYQDVLGVWGNGKNLMFAAQQSDGVSSYTVDAAGNSTLVERLALSGGSPYDIWCPGFVPTVKITGFYSLETEQEFGTVLELHCDGTDTSTDFPDVSPSGHALTAAGNAQVDTAQKKFGTASLLLDGTGDWLTAPNSTDFDFDGDFTIECWVRFGTVTSTPYFLATAPSAATSAGWALVHATSNFYFVTGTGTGSWAITASKSWTPSTGTWYHLAASRRGDQVKVFVDGIGGTAVTYAAAISSTQSLIVGNDTSLGAGTAVNGHIDEVRIIKGRAIYTTNFVPPTAAPSDPNLGDTWTEFSSGAIETGSDYGTGTLQTGSLVAYWRPDIDIPGFEGRAKIKLYKENE